MAGPVDLVIGGGLVIDPRNGPDGRIAVGPAPSGVDRRSAPWRAGRLQCRMTLRGGERETLPAAWRRE